MEAIDFLVTDQGLIPEQTTAMIRFTDGTELQTDRNGDCFILPACPEFPEDLSTVTVEIGDETTVYHNAKVQDCASVDSRFWFTFIEESPAERTIRELREENTMLEDAIIELAELIGG